MEVDGKDHASAALRREITPVALNRRLSGSQRQSGLLSLVAILPLFVLAAVLQNLRVSSKIHCPFRKTKFIVEPFA